MIKHYSHCIMIVIMVKLNENCFNNNVGCSDVSIGEVNLSWSQNTTACDATVDGCEL
jgi:hypothetical protein